ncbi:3-hydroxyacyl-CoA dehydrogenase NAD-binding domain-containing protein [Georgenia sp. AZ-5]|uniref:3-hydroxyacyl-CoA dehydrogenase NAD-binding domain-containing protein n=1 Tax=Georgenia sp. AZ-5 TaxID=3367526 RepID=UPI003754AD52
MAATTPAPYTERVTIVRTTDIEVTDLGTVRVLTLAPEDGTERPCSLGPRGLRNVADALAAARERADEGHLAAVVVTGTGRSFLAGADLKWIREAGDAAEVRAVAELGHEIVAALADLPVPTLAHLNGAALGGGLELALACDYRTVAEDVRAIGLPETYLGLVPGWGGCTILPRLLGPDAALQIIVDNPARNNRLLDARGALALGLVDVVLTTPATREGVVSVTGEGGPAGEGAAAAERAAGAARTASSGPAAAAGPAGAGADATDAGAPAGAGPAGPSVEQVSSLARSGVPRAAIEWLRQAIDGQIPVRRLVAGPASPHPADPAGDDAWVAAVDARHGLVQARAAGGAEAPALALRTVAASRTRSRAESFVNEDEALTHLVMTDELRASLYAVDLVGRRSRRPKGRPEGVEPREIRSVGVAGAGLMAGQLALLLVRALRVPVTMRDLDDERARRGLAAVHGQIDQAVRRGALDERRAAELRGLLRVTTDVQDLRGADLVVEAVFEELEVKKQVFAELEQVVATDAILATNTSALSVTAMAADLEHPERVVGLHFFNPVAQMPLVEVVRAERTDDVSYATTFAIAQACRKTPVAVSDAPGFVVNRLLVRLLGEVLGALEEGTTVADADRALVPMGLPMGPFQLLQLVGPAVAEHVLVTLRSELGDRYPDSPGLAEVVRSGRSFVTFEGRPTATSPVDPGIEALFGSRRTGNPLDAAGLLDRVRRALAEETALLLEDGVVDDVADVDLAMMLGAGWPLHNGGLTPYLDRTGTSEAVLGRRFHAAGEASLPAVGA